MAAERRREGRSRSLERAYAEEAETPAPSPFLVALDEALPRRGRALDLAGGFGRNALWLARRGLDVIT